MATDPNLKPIEGVFGIRHAAGDVIPVIFDSPHSGTVFPDGFTSPVSRHVLLQSSDLFVDELYGSAPAHGATLLHAAFPRVYVDPNRSDTELDELVASMGALTADGGSDKGARGIGLVWTRAHDNSAIYDRPLTEPEIRHRIDNYWAPYHAALEALLAARHETFGAYWHVDCHSMPGMGTRAMGDEGGRRADFIIGDRDGTTCSADFTALIVDYLKGKGFDTRVNELFRGAEIVRRYGDPASGRHSVQIEMNRQLYMDEANLTRLDGFAQFRDDVIAPLVAQICAFAVSELA